jgi:hypothetical protein
MAKPLPTDAMLYGASRFQAGDPYPPITDWSPAARAALVAGQEPTIRLLLDEAFTVFLDEPQASLRPYGFRGDDPVSDAVDFCVARFRDGTFDGAQIHAGDRSFRIFTRAQFWLSQRVGEPQRRRIEGQRQRRVDAGVELEDVPGAAALVDAPTSLAVAATAKVLCARTCAGVVRYWLRGSAAMRACWFGHDAPEGVDDENSAKAQSFYTADALFRFSALLAGLVPEGRGVAERACVETWFTPCKDVPPYQVPAEEVARRLALDSARAATGHRRAGLGSLIGTVLTAAEATAGKVDATGAVLRQGLRPGLLNAYRLEDERDLAERLRALPREFRCR